MGVQLDVTISVDSLTAIVHRVGKGVGVIRATHYAASVKVIVFSLMVIAKHVCMDCGDGSVSFIVMRHVSAHAELAMGVAHLVTSDIGEQTAVKLAIRDALRLVLSLTDHVSPVVTGSGETVVSMRAQTVYHQHVLNPMDIVYFAKQASGEEIVPRIAVLVAHQTRVVLLMALVYLVLINTGENNVLKYAATGVPVNVHSLTGLVCVKMDTGECNVPSNAMMDVYLTHASRLTGLVHNVR